MVDLRQRPRHRKLVLCSRDRRGIVSHWSGDEEWTIQLAARADAPRRLVEVLSLCKLLAKVNESC
jgi:hypothetical protein